MDDFIFTLNNNIEKTDAEYFCMIGSEDYLDTNKRPRLNKDGKKVLAKKIIKPNTAAQYYIKISNQNKLFNPLTSGLEDKSYSIVDNVCRPSDKFRSVNPTVFEIYLNFLSSQNILWLNKAEREVL